MGNRPGCWFFGRSLLSVWASVFLAWIVDLKKYHWRLIISGWILWRPKYQIANDLQKLRGLTLVFIVWPTLPGNTCITKPISVKQILQVRISSINNAVVWRCDAAAGGICVKRGSANYICHPLKGCCTGNKTRQLRSFLFFLCKDADESADIVRTRWNKASVILNWWGVFAVLYLVKKHEDTEKYLKMRHC